MSYPDELFDTTQPLQDIPVPPQVKVNWFDPRRGFTTFMLDVGVHVTADEYLRASDEGQFWINVSYPRAQYLAHRPDIPAIGLNIECAVGWHVDVEQQTSMIGFENGKSFAADIQFPTVAERAAGAEVSWPGAPS